MSGHVGNLNPYQEKMLKEFKVAVKDVHRPDYDDYYYLRWLRAREFDKKRAEAMLRKNLAWRKKIDADRILTNYKPVEIVDKYYPRGYFGLNKDGTTVRYMPYGNLDLKGFALSVQRSEMVKFISQVFESDVAVLENERKKTGKVVETFTYILDLDGYTFRRATNMQAVQVLNELLKTYEANYPERLKVAYFINAPSFFSLVLALSRPFLTDTTVNKFKVYGKDYQGALREAIDPSILPVFLGGDRTDPDGDPRCKSVINFGAFVPKSFYFERGNRKFSQYDGVRMLTLDKRCSQKVEVDVVEAGSNLQLEVGTDSHDVAVGIYYRTDSDNEEELMPVERMECQFVPESIVYACDKTGTYVILFDNSYSWFTQKKVLYKISVFTPEEILSSDL